MAFTFTWPKEVRDLRDLLDIFSYRYSDIEGGTPRCWASFMEKLTRDFPQYADTLDEIGRVSEGALALLLDDPTKMTLPRVFISHRQGDEDLGRRAACIAQQHGYDYWLDIHDPTLAMINVAQGKDPTGRVCHPRCRNHRNGTSPLHARTRPLERKRPGLDLDPLRIWQGQGEKVFRSESVQLDQPEGEIHSGSISIWRPKRKQKGKSGIGLPHPNARTSVALQPKNGLWTKHKDRQNHRRNDWI